PAPGAAELSLSGRVYSAAWSDGFFALPTFAPFPAGQTRTVSTLGGTGTIANGQLSFAIGTPTSLRPVVEGELWFPGDENVTFDPPETRAVSLWLRTQAPGDTHSSGDLGLEYIRFSISGSSFSGEWVSRGHIYVDRDVVVRLAQDQTGTWTDTENGTTFNETYIARAFTITLREGWNVVHFRDIFSGSFAGPAANPTSVTMTQTSTVTTADPGRQLRWMLEEWGSGWDDYSETLDLSRGALPSAPPFRTRR
ncbi:MAG: hypothetical protein FWB78_10395, partial [Treponema sp.]|nr:hypothetical protein [Treponema sp.]